MNDDRTASNMEAILSSKNSVKFIAENVFLNYSYMLKK